MYRYLKRDYEGKMQRDFRGDEMGPRAELPGLATHIRLVTRLAPRRNSGSGNRTLRHNSALRPIISDSDSRAACTHDRSCALACIEDTTIGLALPLSSGYDRATLRTYASFLLVSRIKLTPSRLYRFPFFLPIIHHHYRIEMFLQHEKEPLIRLHFLLQPKAGSMAIGTAYFPPPPPAKGNLDILIEWSKVT